MRFQYLKSFTFVVVFYIYTLALCIIFLPTLFMKRKYAALLPCIWAKYTPFLLKFFCGLTIRVKGLENIPKKNGYIIASKHQSALETIVLFNYIPNLVFILKRQLFFLPIAGWYFVKLGCILINRSGGTKTMKNMTKLASKRLAEGMNIAIFPEGTRMAPGIVGKYSPGVAFLYDQTHADVLPVALNTGVYWPKNKIMKFSGQVDICFLPLIKAGLDKRTFLTQLQNSIEEAQKELPSCRN